VIRGSIRVRLTAWYVAVLASAALLLIGASWWLSDLSVRRATDTGLRARTEGVRRFLENPKTRVSIEGLRDEFGEYAELTRNEALLEVIDAAGVVLCRPSIPGWESIASAQVAHAGGPVHAADRTIGELPFRVASSRIEARHREYRVTVAAPMGPAYAALRRFHRLLFLLAPVVLAVAGVGGYWVSRRALAPVDRMTRAVQAISLESLDRRLEVPAADDELRRLAVTFNDMLARLETAVGDIVRFTADASHELRTPVALVRTTAELALRRERTADEYRSALVDVLEHSQRMSALVEDLLVLARMDAGVKQSDGPCDLGTLASDTSRELTAAASRRSVRLAAEIAAPGLVVHGDRGSLRRLLFILLDNAVKYTPPAGEVRLRVCPVNGVDGARAALLEVSDDGIGLDESEAPRVFERFYRGARARREAPEGSGLGLAIARTIVERHHGTIALAAAGGDNGRSGCRVQVLLPVDRNGSARAGDGASTCAPD
jgi:heavy metal sensor kinase